MTYCFAKVKSVHKFRKYEAQRIHARPNWQFLIYLIIISRRFDLYIIHIETVQNLSS